MIVKFFICVSKTFSNFIFSTFVKLILDTQSTLINRSPNILFLSKLCTKLVFPQPVCPTTKILLEILTKMFRRIDNFHSLPKTFKNNFLSSVKSLCFDYFQSFSLTSQDDKMPVFVAKYSYKAKFLFFSRENFSI